MTQRAALPATTKALQFTKSDRKLRVVSLPLEDLADLRDPRAVVIRVRFAGICGSDLHVLDGTLGTSERLVLGHEFSGIVAFVGPSVTHVKAGDAVVVDPNEGCFRCGHCFCGRIHFCQHGSLTTNIGLVRNGGMSEYCVVPDVVVHPLPKGTDLAGAALVEPMSCVARGYDNLRKDQLTCMSRILVLGAGIAGLLWSQLLHHSGFRCLAISEPQEGRRRIAQGTGLFEKVLSPEELRESEAREGSGFDVVIEASGCAEAVEESFRLLRRGGQLVIFGYADTDGDIRVNPRDILMKELSIVSSFLNPLTYPKAIDLIRALQQDGKLDYKRLGIETFTLDEHVAAVERLRGGHISKAVFAFE